MRKHINNKSWEYLVLIPLTLMSLSELSHWKVINIGVLEDALLILGIMLCLVLIVKEPNEKSWKGAMIGLALWGVIKMSFPFLSLKVLFFGLLILGLLCIIGIIVMIIGKIKLPILSWFFYGSLFILLLLILSYDYYDNIEGNFYDIRLVATQWVLVSIPFLLLDILLAKKFNCPPFITFISWIPLAVFTYPMSNTHSETMAQRLLAVVFWIVILSVFYFVLPWLLTNGKLKYKNLSVIVISVLAILIAASMKWLYLTEFTESMHVFSPLVLIIKSCVLICYPLVFLVPVYQDRQK